MVKATHLELRYPNLALIEYTVTSPKSQEYNCSASCFLSFLMESLALIITSLLIFKISELPARFKSTNPAGSMTVILNRYRQSL